MEESGWSRNPWDSAHGGPSRSIRGTELRKESWRSTFVSRSRRHQGVTVKRPSGWPCSHCPVPTLLPHPTPHSPTSPPGFGDFCFQVSGTGRSLDCSPQSPLLPAHWPVFKFSAFPTPRDRKPLEESFPSIFLEVFHFFANKAICFTTHSIYLTSVIKPRSGVSVFR